MPRVLALTLMLALLLSIPCQATTVERLSFDALVNKADSIVVGKVNGARSYWSANGKVILTSYTVEVQETIKGSRSRTLELTAIGGTVGQVTLYVAGMPVFEPGEDAVVFVENTGSFLTVVGLSQGKFELKNGEIANNVNALEFLDGRSGSPLRMGLQTFRDKVKAILSSRP